MIKNNNNQIQIVDNKIEIEKIKVWMIQVIIKIKDLIN